MASLIVLLIAAGCAAYQFLKGTLLRAFATFIVTICATIISFGFFEVLSGVFIGGRDSSFKFLPAPWMQTLSFLLLFLFSFALLQTLAQYLTKQPVDLGLWPERIGRAGFGILSGLVLASFLLTAAAMAPLQINILTSASTKGLQILTGRPRSCSTPMALHLDCSVWSVKEVSAEKKALQPCTLLS